MHRGVVAAASGWLLLTVVSVGDGQLRCQAAPALHAVAVVMQRDPRSSALALLKSVLHR